MVRRSSDHREHLYQYEQSLVARGTVTALSRKAMAPRLAGPRLVAEGAGTPVVR